MNETYINYDFGIIAYLFWLASGFEPRWDCGYTGFLDTFKGVANG